MGFSSIIEDLTVHYRSWRSSFQTTYKEVENHHYQPHNKSSITEFQKHVWIKINYQKFLKRWEYQFTLPVCWEICMEEKKQVRTGQGTTDWFQVQKGICQGCILSPCLFNIYADYIMQNARLRRAQTGIKIARRNINHLRHAYDTTLWQKAKRNWRVTWWQRRVKVQFSSVAQSCLNLCDPMDCSTPGFTVHHQHPNLLKFLSIESFMPSIHLILCRPLLLLPSIFPSIRVFSNESVLHIRWPKYWSFSFSISLFNEYSGLISFRMNWLDLLAVQGTLRSLLQHHSSKAILWHSAFFIVQLSHQHMTTGENKALTRQTFFGKIMSLLFNMLSGLVIIFLPRSKCLLISCLQSPSAVILALPKWSLPLFPLFHHLFAMKWWEQMSCS